MTRATSFVVLLFLPTALTHAAELEQKECPGDKMGAVDAAGKLVVPCDYDFVSVFRQGFAFATRDKKTGIVDRTGKVVVALDYELIGSGNQNRTAPFVVVLRAADRSGIALSVARDGSLSRVAYDQIADFAGGSSYPWPRRVVRGGKIGFLGEDGREILPAIYDRITRVGGGDLVEIGPLKGLVNTATGTIFLPVEYEYIQDTHIPPLVVKKHGKVGLASGDGKLLIAPRYDSIEESYGWPKQIGLGGKFGYLAENGHEIVPPTYQAIQQLDDSGRYFRAQLDGKWGLLEGARVMLPFRYEAIEGLFGEVLRVQIDGRHELIELNGHALGFTDHPGRGSFGASSPLSAPQSQVGQDELIDSRARSLLAVEPGRVQLRVDTKSIPYQLAPAKDRAKYMSVYVINDSSSIAYLASQDGSYRLIQEARDPSGVFRPIETWQESTCGNSYFAVPIAAGRQRMTIARRYQGPLRTHLRLRLTHGNEVLLSNEYEGSIDPRQWLRR
jgi:hypothetical protein